MNATINTQGEAISLHSGVFNIPGLTLPDGARAFLVSPNDDGRFDFRPVEMGASVVNLRRDLISHLNDAPVSTDFLQELRDYCDARMGGRRDGSDQGPTPERARFALDAVYQSEAIVAALEHLAQDFDSCALPLLLVSMCKRLGDLNGVIMSALGAGQETDNQMKATLGNV